MSTLDENNSIGQVVGYTLICGVGFGSVCLSPFSHAVT